MTRPLRVGVFLNDDDRIARWADVRDLARVAEDAGFNSIWLGDHLLFRDADGSRGPIEAWSALAGIAVVTERIQFGSLVASTSFRAPALLAKAAATLDDMSGGRFTLGLGAGWNRVDYSAYGFPFDHRVERFGEALQIIATLLHEGQLDFVGQYYEVRDCELLPRTSARGRPPLLVGSIGERVLRLALPIVDAWNTWFTATGNGPDGAAAQSRRVDAICAQVGRDPGEVERTAAVLVRPWTRGRRPEAHPSDGVQALVGRPAEIAATLQGYARAGFHQIQLVINPMSTAAVEALVPVLEELRRIDSAVDGAGISR